MIPPEGAELLPTRQLSFPTGRRLLLGTLMPQPFWPALSTNGAHSGSQGKAHGEAESSRRHLHCVRNSENWDQGQGIGDVHYSGQKLFGEDMELQRRRVTGG